MIRNGVAESGEAARVAEEAAADRFEDFGEIGIELKVTETVGVSEVLNILSKVAKEEDVGFAYLAGDFNLLASQQNSKMKRISDLHLRHRMYR